MFSRVFRTEALRRTENLAGDDIKHLLESTEELLKVASLASGMLYQSRSPLASRWFIGLLERRT